MMRLSQSVLVEVVRGNGRLESLSATLCRKKIQIVNTVQKLKKRGFLTISAPGCYVATEPGADWVSSGKTIKSGQAERRPRTATRGLRQRAWWVIRARKQVTLPELLATLADGSEKDAASNLSRYLGSLVQAGFLTVHGKRVAGASLTSPGHKRYQVVRDNGRLAPVVRQTARVVFDPNSGEVFDL